MPRNTRAWETIRLFFQALQRQTPFVARVLDVVGSRLPDAEFAFLAACHTAELTDDSPADEALHLTDAMQYCGFRSVVGTMWAMADTDGRDLAGNFYKLVFSGRRTGVQY